MFWNRREVYVTQSIDVFTEARRALHSEGVKFTFRIDNRGRSENYYVYVHNQTIVYKKLIGKEKQA